MAGVDSDTVNIVEQDSDSDFSKKEHSIANEGVSRNVSDYEVIDGPIAYNSFANDPEFGGFVREVEVAIEAGINPKLSVKGTSGCYFVKNKEQVFVCVFCAIQFL